EICARFLETLRIQLPQTLALVLAALAPYEPRRSERVQMLGHGLARDGAAGAESHDGERPFVAQPGDESETRLVTERREDRRGAPEARGARPGRHGGGCCRSVPSSRPRSPGRPRPGARPGSGRSPPP